MSFARKIARRRARLIAYAQGHTIRMVWHAFRAAAVRDRSTASSVRRLHAAGRR